MISCKKKNIYIGVLWTTIAVRTSMLGSIMDMMALCHLEKLHTSVEIKD